MARKIYLSEKIFAEIVRFRTEFDESLHKNLFLPIFWFLGQKHALRLLKLARFLCFKAQQSIINKWLSTSTQSPLVHSSYANETPWKSSPKSVLINKLFTPRHYYTLSLKVIGRCKGASHRSPVIFEESKSAYLRYASHELVKCRLVFGFVFPSFARLFSWLEVKNWGLILVGDGLLEGEDDRSKRYEVEAEKSI